MRENDASAYHSLTMKERTRLAPQARCRQNAPIAAHAEGKRVYQKEPVDALSWAYMKLLRERDRTRRVFTGDPFVEAYLLRDQLYGILSISADGGGDVWSYLDIGPEQALLVDTGFGIGKIGKIASELCDGKPLVVVNTHSHFDHAYGNCQFAYVYCHEYEAPSLAMQNSRMWDYLFDEKEPERGIWLEMSRKDVIPFREYTILACPDGFLLDLGRGRQVELIHLGGHTPGHAAFLDREKGWLFCGDDIVSMRVGLGGPRPGACHPECATVPFLKSRLENLWGRRSEFTHLFPGHFVTDLEAACLGDMVEALSAVCAAPFTAYSYKRDFPAESLTRYYREVNGLGTISYSVNSFAAERA